MVPFIDMINHKRPKQSLWGYDDGLNAFKIEAYGDCLAGTELFDSYGKKCNSRYLLNYGFIEEDNDANEYPFSITLDESIPFCQEKANFLEQPLGSQLRFKLSKDFDSQAFFEFLSFLRFCVVSDIDELASIIVSI
jgi:histone-lysine N-methyltransferase SETD3